MAFSSAWLALREPADHAARDAGLLARAGLAAGPEPVIVDLGAGTGSTVRAFAERLPGGARWRLVDADAGLLALAGQGHAQDLRDLAALPLDGATLVTASALLDLVSAGWLDGLVARITALRLPFYAALSYDGMMVWDPPLAGDGEVTAAFNRHQHGDKGFGPALGPEATGHAAAAFRAAGYTVATAESPWCLAPPDAALQQALLDGIATAAVEAGAVCDVPGWEAARRDALPAASCRIGHADLLALPPGAKTEGGW